MSDPMLPVGTGRCKCCGCGRYFTSVSGFDRHQILRDDGSVICRDPATIVRRETGEPVLVLNEKGYWQYPEMAEMPVFAVAERENATKRPSNDQSHQNVQEVLF